MTKLFQLVLLSSIFLFCSFSKSPADLNTITESSVAVIVYSGNCTLYKKTLLEGNKIKYTPIGTAVGKVVIDPSIKKFTFFYNGKLVFSQSRYLSYIDNDQGGEGFTFSGEYSAHRLTAERRFTIYDEAGTFGRKGSFLGYEYEIANYKIN